MPKKEKSKLYRIIVNMNWYNRYQNKNKQALETRLNLLLNRKNWALNFSKKPDLKILDEEIELVKNLLGKI